MSEITSGQPGDVPDKFRNGEQSDPESPSTSEHHPSRLSRLRDAVSGRRSYTTLHTRTAATEHSRDIMTPEQRHDLDKKQRARVAAMGFIATAAAGYLTVKYDVPAFGPLNLTLSRKERRTNEVVSPSVAHSGSIVPSDRNEAYLRRARRAAERLLQRKSGRSN